MVENYSFEDLVNIIEIGGKIGIKTIIATLKREIVESDDDYEGQYKVDRWKRLNKLSEIACSNEARGDSDDYHNLAVEFARLDLYEQALNVLEKGLIANKFSPDLLADMILYGIEGGQINRSDVAYNKIIKLDRNVWGWRAYSFVISYYIEKAKNYPCGKKHDQYKELSIKTAEEFVDYAVNRSPRDTDRAYYKLSSVYALFGVRSKEDGLLHKGYNSVNIAPQCSLGIADELYERGKYNDALPYIEKCILAINNPQPDINPSYVHLIYALAKTQRFLDKTSDEDFNGKQIEIEDIYKHFHIATDAYGASEVFKKVSKQTIKALEIQTGIDDRVAKKASEEFI